MSFLAEIKTLAAKELALEMRNRAALNGIMLYTFSSIFIYYLSFRFGEGITPIVWNTLFWILVLFSAMNAIGRSFSEESSSRQFYYYFLASPIAIISAKILYNTLLVIGLNFLAYLMYSIILGNPVQDQLLFTLIVSLGGLSFGSCLTLVSGIASKASHSPILMAILSFPIILPMLLMLIKASKNAMDGLERAASFDELAVLGAINLIIITLSLLLFPYLWRS